MRVAQETIAQHTSSVHALTSCSGLILLCVWWRSLVAAGFELAYDQHLKVIVQETGIYSATDSGRLAPTLAGTVLQVHRPKLLRGTTAIPIVKGLRFGLRYALASGRDLSRQTIPLRMVTKFPVGSLQTQKGNERVVQQEYIIELPFGSVGHRIFHLDEDWELVSGVWSFEFWHGNRKVGEQEFCLFDPADTMNSHSDELFACKVPTS